MEYVGHKAPTWLYTHWQQHTWPHTATEQNNSLENRLRTLEEWYMTKQFLVSLFVDEDGRGPHRSNILENLLKPGAQFFFQKKSDPTEDRSEDN